MVLSINPPKELFASGVTVFNTNMGAVSTFQDLDLSGIVGSKFAFVMLEVTPDASVTYIVKPKGYGSDTFSNHYNSSDKSPMGTGVSIFEGSGEFSYLWMATDASGVVQHAAGDNTTTFLIKLVGYIK